MKTLHLSVITIIAIASLVILSTYIIFNPIIHPRSVELVGFVRVNQTQAENQTTSLPESPIKEMDIIGLNETYAVGQPINATIKYTGYINGGVEPDVEILDPYGDKVWDSCCVTHTETPSFSFGTFTFKVLEPIRINGFLESEYPVFNSAGNYTMIASLDNRTAQRSFNVVDDTNMTYPLTSTNETVYHDHPNPGQYSIVNATPGIPVENDTLASKMVGFKASSPTYLPPGYQVKLIKVEKGLPLVTIFASRYPLTNKTTSAQFFHLVDPWILLFYPFQIFLRPFVRSLYF